MNMTSIFSHKVNKKILLMDFFFACLLKNLSQGLQKKYSYVFLVTSLFTNLIYVFSLDICHIFLFYVEKEKGRHIPQERGRILTAFLNNFFGKYIEYDFTADLEKQLDKVSDGKLNYKNLLKEFWNSFKPVLKFRKKFPS